MTPLIALVALLHMLVPIYWLGGDLGAFYGSNFLRDPKRSVDERMLALKILNNVDMAPRTALILALPTGFTLGWMKGWLPVGGDMVALLWLGGLLWLSIAWGVHLRHGPAGAGLKKIDMGIRYVVLAGLVGVGGLGVAGQIAIPLFIALKLLVLAACMTLGLIVRRQLVPLFPAIITMKQTGPTPESNAAIDRVLGQTKPTVMVLWVFVLIACWLGLATPV